MRGFAVIPPSEVAALGEVVVLGEVVAFGEVVAVEEAEEGSDEAAASQ